MHCVLADRQADSEGGGGGGCDVRGMQRWHLTKAVDRQLIEVKQTDGREILRQRERERVRQVYAA